MAIEEADSKTRYKKDRATATLCKRVNFLLFFYFNLTELQIYVLREPGSGFLWLYW